MNKEEFEQTYMLEAYRAAVDYFNGYSDRYATRFNIFITIEVALFGLLASTGQFTSPQLDSPLLVLVGLVFSILFYVQSAQDKYILKKQIERVNGIRCEIEARIENKDIPALFTPLDKTDSSKAIFVYENIVSWRSNFVSLTRIPPVTALVLVVGWVLVLICSC